MGERGTGKPPVSLGGFRIEARAFLEAHTEPRPSEALEWGQGDDSVALFDDRQPEEESAEVQAAKAWRALAFDAGFGWIDGPPVYGGRGLPDEYARAYRDLEARYVTPDQTCFAIGLGMVAPTILEHGGERVKHEYLPAMHRGMVIACQLFSEPNAGSDLAGVETRAVRDSDTWVISGQKVWTSWAQHSDLGLLLARTSPDKPKHHGLTMFLVDMHAAGVTVRPLRQMTGGSEFNEVFLDEVRVMDHHRLSTVDAGWGVALTTLMNERAAVGGGSASPRGEGMLLARLLQLARRFDTGHDPVVRSHLADVYGRMQLARLTRQRALDRAEAGTPGPELSIAKLSTTRNLQLVARTSAEILGPSAAADDGEWGTFAWAQLVLGAPGFRIGGGTDEVQRNILAERVLGLPKEPGPR